MQLRGKIALLQPTPCWLCSQLQRRWPRAWATISRWTTLLWRIWLQVLLLLSLLLMQSCTSLRQQGWACHPSLKIKPPLVVSPSDVDLFLEVLEGKTLPAFEVLMARAKSA